LKRKTLLLERKTFLIFVSISLLTTLVAIAVVDVHIVSGSPQTVTQVNEVQEKYSFVKKWGSEGTGDGQFQRVHDLDFDPSEKNLYVVDRDGNRIQVFDKDGTFLWKWGSKGTGDGQFTVPYSIDVDSHGNVWVVDRGNHRIQKFDKDGNFLFNF
jgi:DNA-binding beta-propeller fold protein YncE